jgi:hypothetical protein
MTYEVQLRNSAGVIGRMPASGPDEAAKMAVVLIKDAGSLMAGDRIVILEVDDND